MLQNITKFVSEGIVYPKRKVFNVEYLGSDNKTLSTYISPEEFELLMFFKSNKEGISKSKLSELKKLIDEYADARYNEGYEACEFDSND